MSRNDVCKNCTEVTDDNTGCHSGHDLEYDDISVTGCPKFCPDWIKAAYRYASGQKKPHMPTRAETILWAAFQQAESKGNNLQAENKRLREQINEPEWHCTKCSTTFGQHYGDKESCDCQECGAIGTVVYSVTNRANKALKGGE
jgi:hypothetical protein